MYVEVEDLLSLGNGGVFRMATTEICLVAGMLLREWRAGTR